MKKGNITPENLNPSAWEEYADEHILLIRAWDSGCPSVFEVVRVKNHPSDTRFVRLRHEIIFLDDYLQPASRYELDKILNGFGYEGFDQYIAENGEDVWLLTSLIAESRGDFSESDGTELTMSETDALAMVKELTGREYGREEDAGT